MECSPIVVASLVHVEVQLVDELAHELDISGGRGRA